MSLEKPGITARVLTEPVNGCVAVIVTRRVRAGGKLADVHAEPSDAAGIAWRWTTASTPVEPLLRVPVEVLDAIVEARLAQRLAALADTPVADDSDAVEVWQDPLDLYPHEDAA